MPHDLEGLPLLYDLLSLDTRTLFVVLFWGNLVTALFMLFYSLFHSAQSDRVIRQQLLPAKLLQAAGYWLLLAGGALPEVLATNLGYICLFVGFFFEAGVILALQGIESKSPYFFLGAILALFVVFFVAMEFVFHSASMGFIIYALYVCVILLLPLLRLVTNRNHTPTERTVGIFLLFFDALLLPFGAWCALQGGQTISSQNIAWPILILLLIIQFVISLPAYLMLIKEQSDRILGYQSSVDPLTGIATKRVFLDIAQDTFRKHIYAEIPLTILYIDVDNLKRINEQHGHSFGDEVVARFAEIVQRNLRGNDFASRYGGDEFVILLSKTEEDIGVKVAQRIAGQVTKVQFDSNPDFTFSVSAGVAGLSPGRTDKLTDLIKNANKAMVSAKNRGRNSIAVFGEAQNPESTQPDLIP